MPDFSRCTLLLVDDAEENLDILVQTLGRDMDISVATDAESALEILAREIPDLILLDIEMPGMDGFELCGRIRANPAMEKTPIIFLSGRSGAADRAKGLALGAVDFITKPFVAADVLSRVRTALAFSPCVAES